MCGIAGMYVYGGPARPEPLARAAQALAHRGPDGQGVFLDGPVGLAHTRLAIIDLAHGDQPLFSADHNLCLVANGEIYNYIELREQLGARGYTFATHSDCEPVLYAYREYGLEFLRELRGMYALALYDRAREELILARDRLGIKPLFLSVTPEGICFASELKALFQLRGTRPAVNPAGLVQFLQSNFTSGATTLVQGIERLLPGEAMVINRQGIVRRWRYWTPEQVRIEDIDYPQAEERFAALMDTVMRQHLRSDVPYGLFLSGGIDSGVLLALLSRHAEAPLRTYSVGFPGSRVSNELAAARRIAAQFATRHVECALEQGALLRALPHAVWAADELMGDYANLPVALLAQRAAQDLKVVFSGEGGDEVFAGYARYRAPRLQRLAKQLLAPGSGGFRTRPTIEPVWQRRLFGPALRAAAAEWREPFITAWRSAPPSFTELSRMQWVDIETWLPDDLLVKSDRMLMACGIEGRVPYLDHRVVEFGLSLPRRLKIQGRTGKWFLRRWAERYLPKDHLWGVKRGFTVPVHDWLRGDLLDELERCLPRHPAIGEWLRPEGVADLIRRQRTRGDQVQPLWRLLQFAIWHTLFVQGDGAAPPLQDDPLQYLDTR